MYQIFVLRSPQKVLAKLPVEIYERLRDSIRELATNPHPEGCKKLSGRAGWRIRVNDYRIIYEIDTVRKHINILAIGHRREVYR